MTLEQQLEYVKMFSQVDLRITPIPPLCLQIWEQAQADGISLGKLFVLRQSLEPGVGGSYNIESGDIWITFDEEHPEVAAKCLLHELAHAKRRTKHDGDIDSDWDEEAEVFRLARQLAVDWGLEEVFTEGQLEQELEGVERLRERHWAAANLAGTTERHLARAAYQALYVMAGQSGWTMDVLDEALHGWSEDPATNAAVVDFPRSYLRSAWRLIGYEGGDFGPLTLAQGEDSGNLLRSTLRQMAKGTVVPHFQRQQRGTWAADFCFLPLSEAYELTRVIAAAQAALLKHPEGSALASWWVYGNAVNASCRLYRLSVDYEDHQPDTELWVLATPERQRDMIAEAAWQRYIAGWVAPRGSHRESVVGLRRESLKEGLQLLWGLQAPSRD